MNYWQVAAGKGARDYSETFLKYGVMLIGDGEFGSYFDNKARYSGYGHNSRLGRVEYFAERAVKGDSVILKRKHNRDEWQILAVGKVTGDYEYLEQFEDVEGWDLRHCRKMEWVCPPKKETILTKGLTPGTFIRVDNKNEEPIEKAKGLRERGESEKAIEIPQPVPILSVDEFMKSLIKEGLRSADPEGINEAINRVQGLAEWYVEHDADEKQSEDETRAFLILPIMLALGWSEQRIKIEWDKIDIAFFHEIYSSGNDPCMILEAKKRGEGLDRAMSQADGYAKKYPRCSRLVVSDGICYHLFEKDDIDWIPKAYMNLLKLKDRHPYKEHIEGAVYLFVNLMPK